MGSGFERGIEEGAASPDWRRWPWLRALWAGIGDPWGAMARARVDLVLWMPVALSCGIGAYFALSFEPRLSHFLIAGVVALAALTLWVRGAEALRFPAACITLVLLGFIMAGVRAHQVAAPVLGFRYYGPVEGRIVQVDRSGTDRIRLLLDQVVLERIPPERTPARVRLSLHGDQSHLDPVPGLRVMLTGHLQPPSPPAAPDAYDFRRNAWFQGLGAVGYVRAPVMVVSAPEPDDRALAGHRLRMRLSQAIQGRIEGQAGAVAAALLTGDRSGISVATNEAMRASNLYHIISISGLHMGMVAGFVFAALRYGFAGLGGPALRWPAKKIAAFVALMAATLYLWVAGPQIATQRAWIMAAVMLIAVMLDRRALSLRTVALAATLLLLWEPESLTEPGFQMSFAATVALILAFGPWGRVSPHIPRLLRPVAMLVLTSAVAGAATAPITAAHFHRMSEYGLLANLLAVPVMGTFVMPAGVIAALLAPLGLAAPALWVMEQGTRWMLWVAEFVSGLEGATFAVANPPGAVLPLMAAGAVALGIGRGALRSLGGIACIASIALWATAPRPALLIAPEGELLGLLTPAGRVLSKSGAGFVASRWLEADGDDAAPEAAASRAGFGGPKGARVAEYQGRPLIHLTGKGALDALPRLCRDGALVVLAARAPEGDWRECDLWDQTRLTETGAVSFDTEGRLTTTLAHIGARLWTRK